MSEGTGHSQRDPQRHPFLQALSEGPILADGAIGTLLLARGVSAEVNLESLNLNDRSLIESIHRDYIRAGAKAIETNTYGANRYQLAAAGLQDRVWEINVWGAKLARQAREVAGQPVFVGGSMGPLGRPLAPLGSLTLAEARSTFQEQAEGLLAGGVDYFIIETASDVAEAMEALAAIREICRLPVIMQFSFTPERVTDAGQRPQKVMERLNALAEPPEVVGLNCGAGPQVLLEVLREMQAAAAFDCAWSVLPNAGMPTKVGNRNLYLAIPEYFARAVGDMLDMGARLVGGCCGTTPEHIRAMRTALDSYRQPSKTTDAGGATTDAAGFGARGASPTLAGMAAPREFEAPTSEAPGSHLAQRLGKGFVISVELDPPRGTVATKFVEAAKGLKQAGVDTINVADSPMARVRMSALVGAHLLQAQVDVETIIHFTTRDRNLMGIQADLLGAHALGIRNVLALTGDPPSLGNVARAKAVYDVDAIGLIHILQGLNHGVDVAQNAIGEPTAFTIGCALSPNADDLDLEIDRFRKKLQAGAHFVMTQPLYEIEPLLRVLNEVECTIPILLGVMPLHSFKQAEYLHNEVPGITIPDDLRKDLKAAGDDGLRVGLERAAAMIETASPYIEGVYVVGSFGKHEPVADFVRQLRAADAANQKAQEAPAGTPGLQKESIR